MRVIGLFNLVIDIPYNYGVLVPETGQSLLQIGEVLQGRGGGMIDKWFPLASRDKLAAHHVRPVESGQLHDPSLGQLYDEQDHYPLRTYGSCGDLRITQHVVSHMVMSGSRPR